MLISDADFAPLADLAEHRATLWLSQRDYVTTHSGLLGETWEGQRPPERLEDLPTLPLIDKDMLRASQRENPPFGAYVATDRSHIRRIHRTGGTTGEAMNLALSAADAEQTALIGARAQRSAGLRPDDIVVHCLN
jgi:phenylacetate-CoA ligase